MRNLLSKENFSENKPKLKIGRRKIFFGLIIFIFLAVLFSVVIPGYLTFRSAVRLNSSFKDLQASVKSGNLDKVNASLLKFKTDFGDFNNNFSRFSWFRFIPFAGVYWMDGKHFLTAGNYGIEIGEIILPTIEPYADILGLSGSKTASDAKTAEDRIDFVVKTINDVMPKLSEVGDKMDKVRYEINQVDPERYPEKIGGRPIRSQLTQIADIINEITSLIIDGKPFLENLPYFLGIGQTKTYLVIFQNDKELRPTGGFITAYSVIKIKDGKIQPVSSNDIYNLDSSYKGNIPVPDPIKKYIKGPYLISNHLFLRDMNWSPDFAISMSQFVKEAEKAGLEKVDGVIGVDTEVLVRLLNVTGPIGVPGYGNYSASIVDKCNCPQVIYELESYADIEKPIVWFNGKIVFGKFEDNRKAILGPLVNSILANALAAPKNKVPLLVQAGLSSLLEKHILLYMFDQNIQKGIEGFNIGARLRDYSGDFLHINDANLGGRKANLYVTQEVNLEIKDKGSVWEHSLEITYKNPQSYDGWLNSVLPNWVRVFVPRQAKLIDVTGLADKEEPYEELGKTVFSGYFELRPKGIVKITFRYEIPKTDRAFKILIQKQPGTFGNQYTLKVNNAIEEFSLFQDKEIQIQ